jgi:hypothetical protein
MKRIVFIVLGVALAAPAAAGDLGNAAPAKTDMPARQTLVRDRQGGDTFADAFLIPDLPFADTGTTVGYTNDYDEVCPYSTSTAPDVVYKLQVTSAVIVDIDLCGSGYDTKVYVYREDFTLVVCNDDFYFDGLCGVYVSKIEDLRLEPAVKYFVVIDGYGISAGDYLLQIGPPPPPCVVPCPSGASEEGEPPLVQDYVDNWNGGCNTPPDFPFSDFWSWYGDTLCGVSGWYTLDGGNHRDTDWYQLMMGVTGVLEIDITAEQPSYAFELGPLDCDHVAVLQSVEVNPCETAHMTIDGYFTGATVWFWVGPTTYVAPQGAPNEYQYVVYFDGLLQPDSPIATETRTWGAVKSLYR